MTEQAESDDRMTEVPTEFRQTTETEIGLRLPDGTEIWPPETWHGRSLVTLGDRHLIFDAIAASATNLGLDEGFLASQYRWVTRFRNTYTTVTVGETVETDMFDPNVTQIETPEPLRLED